MRKEAISECFLVLHRRLKLCPVLHPLHFGSTSSFSNFLICVLRIIFLRLGLYCWKGGEYLVRFSKGYPQFDFSHACPTLWLSEQVLTQAHIMYRCCFGSFFFFSFFYFEKLKVISNSSPYRWGPGGKVDCESPSGSWTLKYLHYFNLYSSSGLPNKT